MITPTTELEAVNTMLRAINESPVSSLSGDIGVDVVTAKATLNEVMRAVQTEGWAFNTEYKYPLKRDASGNISVPANALVVDVNSRQYAGIDPVLRGTKLYDRMNHTFTFTVDLEARIIFGLNFTDMPQSARHYVTYRAARKFQDDSLGSSDLHQFNVRDEAYARALFVNDQAEDEDLNYLADTPGFQQLWSY